MLKQTDTSETVRLSQSINDEEIKYVMVRKTLIKEWLNSLEIYCELEDVPNIALLGSGGGERAAVGMLGSLFQLEQDNLLGSLLYMCGVSGTTWCMSSLYSDLDWSLNKRCDEVIEKLKGPTVDLKKAVDWLKQWKDSDQDFNLTDFWRAFTACYFMKEMDTRRLSEEAHRNSTNPYPIYSAIELDRNKQHCTKGDCYAAFMQTRKLRTSELKSGVIPDNSPPLFSVAVWFEMTPHECGFSGLGAFIDTSCLRCKFEGGIMTEKRKEMDMVLLQGICGSVIADGQMDIAYVGKKIWDLLFGGSIIWIVQNIFPLLIKWEWGTTSNFLFKLYARSFARSLYPPPLARSLALKMNSPYPPILRPSREVDLIISLDFSEEDPFETVFSSKQYADELKLPFPPVDERMREEKDHPQDCYVFEGQLPKQPTIMHMPLFNLQNCQDEQEIKKESEKYTTFQQPYSAPMIEHLLEKAKANMRNNRDRILGQIIMAVQRRKNRKSVAQ
eukprot:XP_014011658.1 PREDICTED: cytosolic phospholipase A2 gamma-like [Salmo salar]